jgi:nucleoside-diphosphate-sugar epimerase
VVLRYGYFYGPGTHYASNGAIAADVRRRRFPVVGEGGGVFSFIHLDDAASATLAALDQGGPGIYNVCDDDPAPLREWLPAYAEALGAKRPWRVPAWVARLAAGRMAVVQATELRGAANEKAKRELGWSPRYPSWRQGFREALG